MKKSSNANMEKHEARISEGFCNKNITSSDKNIQ